MSLECADQKLKTYLELFFFHNEAELQFARTCNEVEEEHRLNDHWR